ncbi:hypothetical protein PRIPAC_72216 [Pristionchus pacificus]|uniref:Uncharacterized protein n=1 Tax=Pristionchus pacificus TaxID=54126 RepID=A0A2A6B4K3_PRIPA|nr:hypothetical protein PRIPAC_72216 [Pristionchus pacificus]|eukprot:PDM60788.1 hypothetical protein PRIPAC_54594 [Pristionchus pacificus]
MDGPARILYCLGHSLRSLLDTLHVKVGRLHGRVDGAELEESHGVGGISVGGGSVVINPGGVGEVVIVALTIADPVVNLGDNCRIVDPVDRGNHVVSGYDEVVLVFEGVGQLSNQRVFARVTESEIKDQRSTSLENNAPKTDIESSITISDRA